MEFDWDPVKNRSNLAKHSLDFSDARHVFDGLCVTVEDRRFDYGEMRFVTIGRLDGRTVVIAYALRGDSTRIISMRKANRREQKLYQERFGKA